MRFVCCSDCVTEPTVEALFVARVAAAGLAEIFSFEMQLLLLRHRRRLLRTLALDVELLAWCPWRTEHEVAARVAWQPALQLAFGPAPRLTLAQLP